MKVCVRHYLAGKFITIFTIMKCALKRLFCRTLLATGEEARGTDVTFSKEPFSEMGIFTLASSETTTQELSSREGKLTS